MKTRIGKIALMQQFIDLLEEAEENDWTLEQHRFMIQQCEVLRDFWQTEPFDEIIPTETILDSQARFDPLDWTNYLKLLARQYIQATDPDRLTELLSCRYSYLTPLEKVIVDRHVIHPVRAEWK